MPEINPEKVCFIISMARRLLSADPGVEPDDSNPSDDGERIILTDAGGATRRELVEYIRALDADETAALFALAWIGRGGLEAGRLEARRHRRKPSRRSRPSGLAGSLGPAAPAGLP